MITFQIGGLTDIFVYSALVSFVVGMTALAVGVACLVFYFKTKRRGFVFVGTSVLIYEIRPIVSFIAQLGFSSNFFSYYAFNAVFSIIVDLIVLALFIIGIYIFYRESKPKIPLLQQPKAPLQPNACGISF